MRTGARISRRGIVVALAAIVITACADRDPVMPGQPEEGAPRLDRTIGVVEVTISGIGSDVVSASAISAASVAELTALRATRSHTAGEGAAQALLPPTATAGGNGTIQLSLVSTGSFTEGEPGNGGVRHIWAHYRVRNAQTNGTAYDTQRRNLTFLAVDTDGTISETAISRMRRFDNSNANAAIATQILPTGAVTRDLLTNDVVSSDPDVLQVFTEEEVAGVVRPAGVKDIFPYGFVVRRAGDVSTRTLPASPAADQFDGVVSFFFKIPLQANVSDDPFTISFMALAVDDDETKITQSLEEQAAEAQAAFEARAASLGATVLRTFLGSGYAGAQGRTICSVRTAGTRAAPVASIGKNETFISLTPNSGKISRNTQFTATFSGAVSGVDTSNFTVRGSVSGQAFVGKAYSGNGTTTITTPAGNFTAGEEVEVVVDGVPCVSGLPYSVKLEVGPDPFTTSLTFSTGNYNPTVQTADLNNDGRLDLIVLDRNDKRFTAVLNVDGAMTQQTLFSTPVGIDPYGIRIGDLNGDGFQDVVVVGIVPTVGSSSAETYLGKGDGTFQYAGSLAVGRTPQYVALGDLNGDGNLDLATSNLDGYNVSVALGKGDGTFEAATHLNVGGSAYYVGFADVDKDGKLDMIATAYDAHKAFVFWGNGTGGFGAPRELAAVGPGGAAVADFNGDGHLDIAVAAEDGYIDFYPGLGDRAFGAAQRTMLAGTPGTNYIAVADLDADGDLDMAVTTWESTISILINNGAGTFTERSILGMDGDVYDIDIGDLNGDGKIDIIAAVQKHPGHVRIFWN